VPKPKKLSRKPRRARRHTPKPQHKLKIGEAAASARIPVTARDRAAGRWFEKLVALQARLRGPGGCPWDREQTHESLRKFLIEEAYEVLEAMESGDSGKFAGEMGDLLLQVIFHSILAEEEGKFTISEVIESVHSKMVRRHPHVFGSVKADSPAAVLKNWEQIKAEERAAESKSNGNPAAKPNNAPNPESVLAGVPHSLPAVLEAYQLTRRAAHIGFDWDNLAGVLDKLDEERGELQAEIRNEGDRKGFPPDGAKPVEADPGKAGPQFARMEEEAGDLLFVAVNIARFLGVDPEIALKKANRKFKQRFTWMESAAQEEGKRFGDLPRARMEELWNESKSHA
jgi:MazG family protein